MTPLLICAYKPRYLEVVLKWLRAENIEQNYRIYAWDNGGADKIFQKFGLKWNCLPDESTKGVTNVGKALAMRFLVDVVNLEMPDAECYVCMDDDIIADRLQIDAIVSAAKRPGLGMIAPRFHRFNSVVPEGGQLTYFDPCPICSRIDVTSKNDQCPVCAGFGHDPLGLRLWTYPMEDRTVHNTGRIAGGLFAVSKASIAKLSSAPYLYPILADSNGDPIVYWTEDATLDGALTAAGLVNGYLHGNEQSPAIHLPDLNDDYVKWKIEARNNPSSSGFGG
jgi:hypothetical protein